MAQTPAAAATRRWKERQRAGAALEPVACSECGRTFRHQGYLTQHLRSHGVNPVDLFWSKVDRSGGPDACWPWAGTSLANGYGWYAAPKAQGGRGTTAHRIALEIALGRPLRVDEEACHHCDNPPCVNPGHLFAGSRSDNQQDASRKGRTGPQRHPESYQGERSGNAVLTEDAVRDIRRRYAAGLANQPRLASEYGVTQTLISRVVLRQAWTHVQ